MKFKYLILFLALGFFSCEDPEYQLDSEITDHTANLVHTWELTSVIQIDHKAGPGKLKELDISTAALSSGVSEITFSSDGYSASGVVSELFEEAGTWKLDHPEFPTTIQITNGSGNSEVPLGKSILSFSEELHLQNDVFNCVDGSLVTGYIYVLNKK